MKILIVEDDICILEMYYEQVKQNGLDAMIVENAETAIQAISENKFDLIVCDGQIPAAGGKLPRPENGKKVLQAAKDAGIDERWVTSADKNYQREVCMSGLANAAFSKHLVLGRVQDGE